jgi:serine/threonine protein kinase
MPHPGELLGGRYRLDDRIAAGGMGEVWQATDTVLERAVAVKTLLADRAADRGFQRRFRHEARALAALRHPGVVPVYDFGSTDAEDAYLVMARVDGEPLNRLLARRGCLTPAETMSVVAQAAQALEAAHTAGIVHRDVKPGNLLVEPDGTVVLVDFGVARSAHSGTMTGAGEVVGTALYIAPEQVARQETGPAADVYALGALAFHCLAGHPPFQGRNPIAIALQHLDEDPPPLADDVPADVRELVRIALAKDPAARFPSAGAMAEAARSAAAHMAGPGVVSHGSSGPDGAQGPNGPDGAQGPNGPDGAQDPNGPDGAQDPDGPGTSEDGTPRPQARPEDTAGLHTIAAEMVKTDMVQRETERRGSARSGSEPDGIVRPGAPGEDRERGGSNGLAATRAGAPWIGVVGMKAFDTTSDDLDYTDANDNAADPAATVPPTSGGSAGAAQAGTGAPTPPITGSTSATASDDDGQNSGGSGNAMSRATSSRGGDGDKTGAMAGAGLAGALVDAAGNGQTGATSSGQAGTAGSRQANTAGNGQAGTAGSRQANTAGNGQAGSAGVRPTGTASTGQASTGANIQANRVAIGQANGVDSGQGGAGHSGTAGTRPAAPARTGLLPPVDGAGGGKRRLLPVLVLAAVALLGVVVALVTADPLGLFTDDQKQTTKVPAAPVSSVVRPSSGEAGRGNAGEAPAKPEKSERAQEASTRSPSPAATGQAEAPATSQPADEETTGTTSAPAQTATSQPEPDDTEGTETDPAENEDS